MGGGGGGVTSSFQMGDTPILPNGGYPHPSWQVWGYPHPSQWGGGYPSFLIEGTPSRLTVGCTLGKCWQEVDGGTPSWDWLGVHPPLGTVRLGQAMPRSVWLLRFPVGGLSCLSMLFEWHNSVRYVNFFIKFLLADYKLCVENVGLGLTKDIMEVLFCGSLVLDFRWRQPCI